jgi:hypothetical protein
MLATMTSKPPTHPTTTIAMLFLFCECEVVVLGWQERGVVK